MLTDIIWTLGFYCHTYSYCLRLLGGKTIRLLQLHDFIELNVSLLTGVLCRYFLHGTRVPYTVAVFVTGIGLGTLEFGTNFELGILGTSVRLWAEINPDLILFVFLPPLLFESTFFMEFHKIKGADRNELRNVLRKWLDLRFTVRDVCYLGHFET
eukprot:Gb_21305 [translate_table: standard]